MSELDVGRVRADFPILNKMMRGRPLIYLDNAATSQKPRQVIDAVENHYKNYNSNVHRGIYEISEEATEAFEGARAKVAKFIGASSESEIVFTRGTTESINLLAYALGADNVNAGDTILLTEMEHHSNLVPWQMLAQRKNARLEFIGLTSDGRLKMEELESKLALNPKIVSVSHASNVLGTTNDARKICAEAKKTGALTIVDGAQSVPHMPVDVQSIGCDFLAFSGHKMLAPAGIGVLYGRKELLEKMAPFHGGGSMISEVQLREFKPNRVPWKFEAGTPNIEGAIGFGAAVDYLSALGMENIHAHEQKLTKYALEKLEKIANIELYGPSADRRCGIVSFNVKGVHAHDTAAILDEQGIAIRAGHHCAQPLMRILGITATARASFYIYNTMQEVDALVDGIGKVKEAFHLA